jgi:hypothetical protein
MLLACLGALAPRPAQAAACCMSATANGVGRLLIWERFAVGLRTSVIGGLGYWDAKARWRPYDDYRDVEWRSSLWSMVGLGRRTSVFAQVPWVLNYRHVGNLGSSVGGGLADIQLGARYELLSIGELLWFPAVALTTTVTLPTGRALEAADAGGSGVTSRGAWAFGAGVVLEKTYLPIFGRLSFGVTVPLPKEREDLGESQRYGVSLQTSLAGGVEVVSGVVVSALARLLWEDAITIGGRRVANSSRVDTGLGLALSWRFDPHWTLQAAVDSGVFLSYLGDNTPGRITGTLGLRYGYF